MKRNKKLRRSAQDILGDVLRKVPLSGVAELNVPKEIRKAVVANIENLRNGVLDVFAVEISRVLSKLDVQKLTDEVLKNYTLKIEAKIELQPKGRSGISITKAKK